jgi:hypothetical protein
MILEDSYAIRVVEDGANPPDLRAGSFWDRAGALRAVLEKGSLTIFESPTHGGAPRMLARTSLPGDRIALHYLGRFGDGQLIALVEAEAPQNSPTVPPAVTALALVWPTSASEPCVTQVPWDAEDTPLFEPMRRARVQGDQLYYWRGLKGGVEIRRIIP